MKFPNLHIVWTAGKNLALPDTLSRNTPPELLTRKTTVEIPKNIKFYFAENETSPRLECKYAVKTDIEPSQIKKLQRIKNNTQQKRVKQHSHKKRPFSVN